MRKIERPILGEVEPLNGRFLYELCQKDLFGVISLIKSHLSEVKGSDTEIYPQVQEDVQAVASLVIGGPKNKKERKRGH